jgi:hypothetical protein
MTIAGSRSGFGVPRGYWNSDRSVAGDQSRFVFPTAIGSGYSASNPDPEEYDLEYTTKVKLAEQTGPTAGGCG